jgi:ubiquinone/menaquinone biosynthesis C-methylase UbiE
VSYKWPSQEGYPEDYTYLGPKQSFFKNPVLRYALLRRLEIGLDFSLVELTGDSVVLEIGAGAGFMLPELARRAGAVTDMDYEDVHLNAVRSMIRHEGMADKVCLVPGDIHRMPFPDVSFDMVLCFSVLEHVSLSSVQEIHRVLKPGGVFIAGIPIETVFSHVGRVAFGIGGHKKGEVVNTYREMEGEIKRHFAVQQFRRLPANGLPAFCSLYDVLKCRRK